MKLLFLALILALNIAISSSDPRWLQVIEEEALLEEEAAFNFLPEIIADPLLHDIFTFGLDNVIANGIKRGKIPNTTFHVVSVSDWSQTDDFAKDTTRYEFTAVAVSDDGNSVIDTTFNVDYNVVTHVKTPDAYISKTTTTIITTTPEKPATPETPVITVPETTEVSQNEEAVIAEVIEEALIGEVNLLPEIAADPFLSEIFEFGITNVIASGISRGRIPNETNFRAVAVTDWSKKEDSYGAWYTFSAIAVSEDGSSVVETTFTVYYDYSTQEKTLNSYTTKTTTTTITTTTPGEGEVEVLIGEDNELAL